MDNYSTKLIHVNTAASVGINRGDMVYQTGSGASAVASPVSAITYGGSVTLANAQATAVSGFLGQSQDMKRVLDTRTDPIEIATAGRVSMTVASPVNTAYAHGTLFGLAGNGTNLTNQVVEVGSSANAIGVLVSASPVYATSVELGLINTITEGV
jgi:hypothetical protein